MERRSHRRGEVGNIRDRHHRKDVRRQDKAAENRVSQNAAPCKKYECQLPTSDPHYSQTNFIRRNHSYECSSILPLVYGSRAADFGVPVGNKPDKIFEIPK